MGGLDTLSEIEKVEVDNRDRPIENIYIQKTQIFVDPFQEADDQLAAERAEDLEKQRQAVVEEEKKKQRAQPLKVYRQGIGKYLSSTKATTSSATVTSQTQINANAVPDYDSIQNKKKKKTDNIGYKLDNFNDW